MKIIRFKLSQDAANFINSFAVILTTEEGNTYLQIPAIFKVEDGGQELSVIDKDFLPEDLNKVLNSYGDSKTTESPLEEVCEEPQTSKED